MAGGALEAREEALVEHSTFEANRVTTTDAGDDGGGAIAFGGDMLRVRRSTFSNNDAYRGGSISLVAGSLQLVGDTFVSAQFGIAGRSGTVLRIRDTTASSLSIANTVVAGTCVFPNTTRRWSLAYNNIESPGTGCRFDEATIGSGNQVGVTSGQLNLGPLADNGGPTPTRLPLAGSVTIDQGRESHCLESDQRHYLRADAQCDIGAVEVGATEDLIFADAFDAD